jgi:hypothetical protein
LRVTEFSSGDNQLAPTRLGVTIGNLLEFQLAQETIVIVDKTQMAN